jgi:hypothetical protein
MWGRVELRLNRGRSPKATPADAEVRPPAITRTVMWGVASTVQWIEAVASWGAGRGAAGTDTFAGRSKASEAIQPVVPVM